MPTLPAPCRRPSINVSRRFAHDRVRGWRPSPSSHAMSMSDSCSSAPLEPSLKTGSSSTMHRSRLALTRYPRCGYSSRPFCAPGSPPSKNDLRMIRQPGHVISVPAISAFCGYRDIRLIGPRAPGAATASEPCADGMNARGGESNDHNKRQDACFIECFYRLRWWSTLVSASPC